MPKTRQESKYITSAMVVLYDDHHIDTPIIPHTRHSDTHTTMIEPWLTSSFVMAIWSLGEERLPRQMGGLLGPTRPEPYTGTFIGTIKYPHIEPMSILDMRYRLLPAPSLFENAGVRSTTRPHSKFSQATLKVCQLALYRLKQTTAGELELTLPLLGQSPFQ